MKKIILLVFCLLTLTGCGAVKLSNGDNAVVTFKDKEGISSNELYEVLKENYGTSKLVDMIDTYLLAKEYKTTTDETDYIDQIISSVKSYAEKNSTEYMTYVAQNYGIYSEADFKDYISLNYRRNLWMTDWVKTQVTEKQINDYYETKTIGDITASHILISTTGTDSMTAAEKKELKTKALETAKEIIVKLNNGEDFAGLAKEYSDDTATASKGGSLGSFNRGEMTAAFEEAAVNLAVGKYSTTPVETEYGYHIIYKTAQKDKPELKDVTDKITETIAKEMITADSTLYLKSIKALRAKYDMKIKDSDLKSDYADLMDSNSSSN